MSTATHETHIAIAGAGLVGSLLACQLGRRGYRVTLCERRPDARIDGFIGGRSINLALSCRGIAALEQVDCAEKVLSNSIRMPGRMLHDESGALTFQPYSNNPADAIHSVSRGQLNITLLEEIAKFTNIVTRFECRCVGADLQSPALLVENASGMQERIEADYVIGCDGAFSAVRTAMQVQDRFSYSQQYLEHGFKELHIPPASDCGVAPDLHNGFAMDPFALHIWPRGHYMMIALPNADRTFTCTLFWPFDGPESFTELDNRGKILPFFELRFPDAARLMPTLVDDYTRNPIGSLVTVRCSPWHKNSKTLLLGDAAHAIVPFFGQGMNAGFEDCRVLDEMIEAHNGDLCNVFSEFSQSRIENTGVIADLALQNFVEMRDSVADPSFLLRKRVERALQSLDAEKYKPLYNLVSFSNMPYAKAKEMGDATVMLAQQITNQIHVERGQNMTDAVLAECVSACIASTETTT